MPLKRLPSSKTQKGCILSPIEGAVSKMSYLVVGWQGEEYKDELVADSGFGELQSCKGDRTSVSVYAVSYKAVPEQEKYWGHWRDRNDFSMGRSDLTFHRPIT